MTTSGIELATFRFVAQHLNHCATAALDCSHYPYNLVLLFSHCDTEVDFVQCILSLDAAKQQITLSTKWTRPSA